MDKRHSAIAKTASFAYSALDNLLRVWFIPLMGYIASLVARNTFRSMSIDALGKGTDAIGWFVSKVIERPPLVRLYLSKNVSFAF